MNATATTRRRPAPVDRGAVIAAARKTFAAEKASGCMEVSEEQWIAAGLRDAGQQALGPADDSGRPIGRSRSQTIAAARAGFANELSAGRAVVCSELAFVNRALRDAGQDPLGDAEAREAGVVAESGRGAVRNARPRADMILAARRSFATEQASGRVVLCSERAWVSTALRDHGQGPVTDHEVRTLGIVDDV